MPALTRALLAVAAALALATTAPAAERPRVVAVNYPLAYFAERLAGDAAEVVLPVPQGVDPAFWRPGIADIQAIQAADLILLNGAGFAAWTERVSLPQARVVDTSRAFADRLIETETILHSHGPDGMHAHAGVASFTWLDQEQALLQAEAVAAALRDRGLAPEADLAPHLAALADDLRALDVAGDRIAARAEGAVLVATHPRYQYLARAYGLTVHALEWEPGVAPDPAQLAALAALAGETDATILLWEAPPPAEARADVQALGLADVVFPTLARPAPEGYVAALSAAFAGLEAALAAAP
ncbi:metal ABC transporter substrate-binding protein [Salinarimonas sp.]|uniref:metal ABC transporter substrate-binding protein n=1 Tax=Salinarimonas sp. TaxID=2766526 RepID=UPI0032D8E41F